MLVPIMINEVPYQVDEDRLIDVNFLIDVHRKVGGPYTLQEESYSIRTPYWQGLYFNELIYPQVMARQPCCYSVPVMIVPAPFLDLQCQSYGQTRRHSYLPLRKSVKSKKMKLSQKATEWLFVGNLPYNCTQQKIENLIMRLSQFGEVVNKHVNIIDGRLWVQYNSRSSANEALRTMDHMMFEGRPLFMDYSRAPAQCKQKARAMSF